MQSTTNNTSRRPKINLLMLAYVAFIMLGLPTGILGVAWPNMRAGFGLPLDALGFLLFATTLGYIISSLFIARLISRFGIGPLLVFSSLASAVAYVGYPLAPSWWIVVAIGALAGFGGGVLDAGLNTYLAAEHNESEMQWLHASFGLGATLSPLVMTASLAQFASWRPGYFFVAVLNALMAVAFWFTVSSWRAPKKERADAPSVPEDERGLMDYHTSVWGSLMRPQVWVAVLLFLLYTGAEFTLGSWTYTLFTEGRGISPTVAGIWAGGFWATFTLGRVLAALYAHRLRLDTLLTGVMTRAIVGGVLFLWNPQPLVGVAGVFIVGFSLAPIFPGLISNTAERVGAQHAANTIGVQMASANLGGAILPALAGVLARRISLETIPVMLLVALVGILALYKASARMPAGERG